MTPPPSWLNAFPIQHAQAAVEALLKGWSDLTQVRGRLLNEKTKEPKLTKSLKIYVENHVARQRGLVGMWSTEDTIGEIDPLTGHMIEERRTDIVYGWNNEVEGFQLVFEFKRLGRQKRHRDHYLEDSGLRRFVTGIYARRQAVAAMVGVLLDPKADVVPEIRRALEDKTFGASLNLRPTLTGEPYCRPSSIFADADFDTEHDRPPGLKSKHGPIRVSHIFLEFGYPVTTLKSKV